MIGDDAAEKSQRQRVGLALNAVGLAAAVAALLAPTAFGILGGIIAAVCLAGSVIADMTTPEIECGPCPDKCDEPSISVASEELAASQQPAQGRQWAAAVAASKKACRSR